MNGNHWLRPAVLLFCMMAALAAVPCTATEPGNILTLDAAVREAVNNNPLIRQAVEKERAAIAAEKSAGADLLPKFSASYSYNRLKETPYAVFGGVRLNIGAKDDFSWDVTVVQPLFAGFALTTKREMALLGIDMQKTAMEQAVLDVAAQAKVAYLRVLLAKKRLEVAREEVEQLEAHVHDAKQLYDQGMVPHNDLLKSQVALAQARQGRVTAESDLEVAISALNIALGRNVMEQTVVGDLPAFEPGVYNLPELFEKALKNRPELRQLKIALKQAGLKVKLASSSYYPTVSLIGRYEQTGDNARATNNDFGNFYNAVVGVQAQWTFFQWEKTGADRANAIHEKAALEQKIKSVRDSVLLQVRQAFQDIMVAEKNIDTARKALAQARENFRITDLQYKAGTTTSTELLDARTFLTQAEVNHYGALYGYRIAEAQLKRAVGEK